MQNTNTVINHTKKWLSNVIIEHTLCPFAKREYDNNRIHYEVVETTDLESLLEHILTQCFALDNDANKETSLLIFSHALSDFEDYLDALDLATSLLASQGYEGIYQLASFHPQYCFADAPIDDPSNYTNRSPYPMLHILREASLTTALESYPKPEKIPQRNIQLTKDLGLNVMKRLLAECYK